MQALIRKLTTHSQYEENLAKIHSTVQDRLADRLFLKTKPHSIQKDILTICSDTFTLAQQLTHIELVSIYLMVLFLLLQSYVRYVAT